MTNPLISELADAIKRGEAVVVATVVETRNSVPRRSGSKMLIFGDGRTIDTIGGGEMEHRVIAAAAAALVDGVPRLLSYSLIDPGAGDPGLCGGEADIFLEPYMPTATLYVMGAGHVGKAVGELGRWLGFRTVVWDDRAQLIDQVTHSDAVDIALCGPIDDALAGQVITANDSIIMVTRNVALDLEILPHLLATPAGYIGLMGSNRRWNTTRARLVDAGVAESDLERVHAPIGIEIRAETPEEIAVSILAQVIQGRRSV